MKFIKRFVIAVVTLSVTYGCFGSVPSYYSRDNWDTAEEANKIKIIKEVNSCKNTTPSQFSMDEWKKFRYADKIYIIDDLIGRFKNDGVFIKLPPSFYVKELDLIMLNFITSKDRESLKNTAIGVTFHALAAMEGDWGNGEDKCEYAKTFFGMGIFDNFKQLFPDKFNKLCNNGNARRQQM